MRPGKAYKVEQTTKAGVVGARVVGGGAFESIFGNSVGVAK